MPSVHRGVGAQPCSLWETRRPHQGLEAQGNQISVAWLTGLQDGHIGCRWGHGA